MSIETPVTSVDLFERLMAIADRAEDLSRVEEYPCDCADVRARMACLTVAVDAIRAALEVVRTFPKDQD